MTASSNEKETPFSKNPWDEAKAFLRGMFLLIQAFLKKQENIKINNLACHLEEVKKDKQIKKSTEGRKH